MVKKIALITGGTGQIGSYQAQFLLRKNYKVYVTTRKLKLNNNLKKLNIIKKVNIITTSLKNKTEITKIIKSIRPNEIYFYSGISQITNTIKNPKEAMFHNYQICKNFINVIKKNLPDCIFFNANSIQIYGNTKKKIKLNDRNFQPNTPYAKSKLKSFLLLQDYRKRFHLKLFNGLFLNTESVLRPKFYVLSKICYFVSKINNKTKTKLPLGNINIKRDWGWCEEYVKIVWKYIQGKPGDFIIGTGKSYSLKQMIKFAFKKYNYEWQKYINIKKNLIRKFEIQNIQADVKDTIKKTGITPKIYGAKLIYKLLHHYQNE